MKEEFDDFPSEYEISADEEKLLEELGLYGESRRKFLGQVGTAAFSVLAMQILAEQEALAAGTATEAKAAPALLN